MALPTGSLPQLRCIKHAASRQNMALNPSFLKPDNSKPENLRPRSRKQAGSLEARSASRRSKRRGDVLQAGVGEATGLRIVARCA